MADPTAPADAAQALQQRVDALAARRLGATGPATALQTLTAGANKGTWSFDAPLAGGPGAFILQCAAPSGAPDPDAEEDDWVPHLDGTQEFQVMLAAQAAGVPVPQVPHILVAEDGLGEGAVTGRVDGETLGVRILRQPQFATARARMAAQCGEILAAVHRVPVQALPFLRVFDAEATLALFRRMLDGIDYPLPALELALRWAGECRPRHARRGLVHGDFRTGNFIVGPDGIRVVLDWEIAHVGNPMEDLGYLCMRTWRFGGAGPVGGFGQREDLFAAYEKAGGGAVDAAEVRFWEVVGSMRWAFGCVRRAFSFRHQDRRKLDFAAVGRRIEEPVYDILDIIEGRADAPSPARPR
jgi:aminoglycoside phosphotransferase (APT) family kinase protein